MKLPSSKAYPKMPSPKKISYLSSSISCKKKILESEPISSKLSFNMYLTLDVDCSLLLTVTLIKSVSIPELGKINL